MSFYAAEDLFVTRDRCLLMRLEIYLAQGLTIILCGQLAAGDLVITRDRCLFMQQKIYLSLGIDVLIPRLSTKGKYFRANTHRGVP